MKNLFLLRHAHSDNNNFIDFERNLSEEGFNKCQDLAKILQDYKIDLIISSSAIRTMQTVETILLELKQTSVEYKRDLYNASESKLLKFLNNIENEYNNVLLVNHNPAISKLAMNLAYPSIHSDFYPEIQLGFSPGSLALYQCNIESWADFAASNSKLISFWR